METALSLLSLDTSKNHECQNLSYKSIKGVNFKDASVKSSFYRSDFRGTKFESDIFVRNNFDLADFISNIFINVEFYEVNFGNSEFKNCFLKNCIFNKNEYNDIAAHSCTFIRCTFQDETFRMTMLDCEFHHCNFINCTFDQCTMDTLAFENCIFLKCELSTMHAENFKFERCTFRDVFLGTCFLGTYLFKETDLKLISFKYRGKVVDANNNVFFQDFKDELLREKRFFEFFNLYILFYADHLNELVNRFPEILRELFNEENPKVLEYNLTGIFEVIEFYLGSDNLPLFYVLRFQEVLQTYSLADISPENSLLYLQHLYRLETRLSSLEYPVDYIRAVPKQIPCTAIIHCCDSSTESAERFLNTLFEYVNKNYLNGIFIPPFFKTISCENGSILLTIASSLLLMLMTAKVIGTVDRSICQMRIENAKTQKMIELISSSQSPAALQRVVSILPTAEPEQETAQKIYEQLGNSYLIDFIIQFFLR